MPEHRSRRGGDRAAWGRIVGAMVVLLFAGGAPAPAAAAVPPVFRWSHPQPHGNNLADLVYREGVYHHVTDSGGIYSSTNRVIWTRRDSGTMKDLRAAAWMGGRLLVTGEEGTALWSDDGEGFRAATVEPATTDWFEGVAATPGLAVAVGDNGALYRTTNGAAWSRVPVAFTDWFSGVGQGGGTFVAVGEAGAIVSSTNGTTWNRRTSGTTADLFRVTHGDGRFLVVGAGGVVLTSANGVSWASDASVGTTNNLLAAVAAAGERLVMGASALRLRRAVGGWEDQLSAAVSPSPAPLWSYAAGVWDGTRYLLGGRTGVLVESFRTNALPWTGLTFWFRGDDSPRNWLWEVAHVGGTYLAVGDQSTVLSSANGIDWDQESAPSTTNVVFYGVGGSAREALIAGSRGTLLRSPVLYTNVTVTNTFEVGGRSYSLLSTNPVSLTGLQWEPVAVGLTTNTLQGLAWDGSRYVVVGGGGSVLVSADALKWSLRALPDAGFLSSVTPFAGGWIASGAGGALFSSPDAGEWTRRVSGTTQWVYRVRLVGDTVVGVGQNGTLLTSTDGIQWVSRTTGTEEFLTDARLAGDWVYVCGTAGTLLRSTNWVDWERISMPTRKALNGLAGAGGQMVVAGAEGAILRALTGEALGPVDFRRFGVFGGSPGAAAGFVFSGTPEQPFVLEQGEDPGAWSPSEPLELDANGTSSLGLDATAVRRFYRTRSGP